jgi:hypothetical protein
MHCVYCPNRFGLRKVDGQWICARCVVNRNQEPQKLRVVG